VTVTLACTMRPASTRSTATDANASMDTQDRYVKRRSTTVILIRASMENVSTMGPDGSAFVISDTPDYAVNPKSMNVRVSLVSTEALAWTESTDTTASVRKVSRDYDANNQYLTVQ
jgi:hypothetical protein